MDRRRPVPFSVVAFAVLCAALPDCKCTCADTAGGAAPAPRPADPQALRPLAIDPEWRTCVTGDVCIRVPADCCGCRNSGAEIAINAKSAGAAGEARVSACGGAMCGTMISQDPSCKGVASCVEGTCQFVGGAPAFRPVRVEPIKPLPPGAQGMERVRPPDPALRDPARALKEEEQQKKQP